MPDWFDDDTFWAVMAPVFFNRVRTEGAEQEARKMAALLDVRPPARILDLGCGPGRLSAHFSRLGYQVVGVDRTPSYLERAKQATPAAEFVHADMRTFTRPGQFDAAVLALSSFGYFADSRDDILTLRNIAESLTKQGAVLIDLMGKEVTARGFGERDWHRGDDGTLVMEERTIVEDWAAVVMKWTLVRDGSAQSFQIRLRLYSAVEIKAAAGQAGFRQTSVFGSLEQTPYDHNASRMIVVARK